jgi:GR25 family glycosyltransferase involved in LPS biosynthesis
MKFIVNTCAGRELLAAKLAKQLPPETIINFDDFRKPPSKFRSTGWLNLQRGWALAGDDAAVIFQDDIVLTSNFMDKLTAAVNQYPTEVIQFFSLKPSDTETRFKPGSAFAGELCYYVPPGVAKLIYGHSIAFYEALDPITSEHKYCPSDTCIAECFKIHKMRYLVWVPNLVDHLGVESKINPRRQKDRHSTSFKL